MTLQITRNFLFIFFFYCKPLKSYRQQLSRQFVQLHLVSRFQHKLDCHQKPENVTKRKKHIKFYIKKNKIKKNLSGVKDKYIKSQCVEESDIFEFLYGIFLR